MFLPRRLVSLVAAAGFVVGGVVLSRGEQQDDAPAAAGALKDGFETPQPSWEREYTDTTVRLSAHDRSDRAAHQGRLAEHFQFDAGVGGQFFVSYALPKVPVTADLGVSLFVRSNKQGAQLFGKVILPADIDPETKAPSYVLLPGTVFGRVDRWEKLELTDMPPAIEEQARILRASTRRPVRLEGAYLERVVVNIMGGVGETEVFLDDLNVAPVPRQLAEDWAKGDAAARAPASRKRQGQADPASDGSTLPAIRLNRFLFEKLTKDRRYVGWFPTAIDAPGANIAQLRGSGADVLVTDANPDPAKIHSAVVDGGFYLLPRLDATGGKQKILDQMAAYPERQAVVMWQIGEHLGREREVAARKQELDEVRGILTAMRDLEEPESHLSTAIVDGEHRQYARSPSNLDVIGVQPKVWGTSQSIQDGYTYLAQRRDLTVRSNPEALFWAWIPATTPPEVVRNIWGDDPPPEWGTPPVQPEQLRLMTYMALSAGYRGLTYMGDADLTRPAGESLLIEMSFLNAEIDLCEQILARNLKRVKPYEVHDPDPSDRPTIANANQKKMPKILERGPKPGLTATPITLDNNRGILMLVTDFAGAAQWQPPQMAYRDLVITPVLRRAPRSWRSAPAMRGSSREGWTTGFPAARASPSRISAPRRSSCARTTSPSAARFKSRSRESGRMPSCWPSARRSSSTGRFTRSTRDSRPTGTTSGMRRTSSSESRWGSRSSRPTPKTCWRRRTSS